MMIEAAGGLSEYINHHLKNLTIHFGQGGFWTVQLDTLGVSVLIGVVFSGLLWMCARRATSGVPSRGQAFVEILVEFVDGQVKDVFHGDTRLLGPLALTIFSWVLLMNLMDVLPLDVIPHLMGIAGAEHFRAVPTSELNMTFAMSLTVLILTIFYSFKAKGAGGYMKEIFTVPFGPWLAPFNLLMNLIELLSKPLSLSMRLFGNMYAGELLFMLIAGLLGAGSSVLFGLGVIGYLGWGIFELLIIVIQAFIFMVLSVVYIAMAQQHH